IAGLALYRLLDRLEDLLQTVDLLLGLAFVFLKGGAKFFGVGCFCHLRQRGQDLLFGVVHVLESLVKQILELLRILCCHWGLLFALKGCGFVVGARPSRRNNAGRFRWFRRAEARASDLEPPILCRRPERRAGTTTRGCFAPTKPTPKERLKNF